MELRIKNECIAITTRAAGTKPHCGIKSAAGTKEFVDDLGLNWHDYGERYFECKSIVSRLERS